MGSEISSFVLTVWLLNVSSMENLLEENAFICQGPLKCRQALTFHIPQGSVHFFPSPPGESSIASHLDHGLRLRTRLPSFNSFSTPEPSLFKMQSNFALSVLKTAMVILCSVIKIKQISASLL